MVVWYVILIVLVLELVMLLSRLRWGSVRKYIKKYKIPIHFHHGYFGILFLVLNLFYPRVYLFVFGLSFFLSDLLHHFVILPLLFGRTEFP